MKSNASFRNHGSFNSLSVATGRIIISGAISELLWDAGVGAHFRRPITVSLFYIESVGSYQEAKRSNSSLGFNFPKSHPHLRKLLGSLLYT
jgi:hypothetical protein